MATSLPSFVPFPTAAWRASIVPSEWAACLDAWVALVEAHLAFTEAETLRISCKDESVSRFLASFMAEAAAAGSGILGGGPSAKTLLKGCFLLTSKILRSSVPPGGMAQWDFLADVSRVYGRKRAGPLLAGLSEPAQGLLDASLSGLKKFLIKNLDQGINGDLKSVEERLSRVNPLVYASPYVASFFLAGSDFLDGLIGCYKIMNPPLRRVIITTTYLCLTGLVEGESPKTSMLTDQLYALRVAADAHKAGPVNANDSLVPELVTATPLLQQVQNKLEASGSATSRAKSVLAELASFRKAGGLVRPKRLIRRKIDKGKGRAGSDLVMVQQEIHIHRLSQISQIQDLFPELGSGFISKLLDEYGEDSEQVIAHMLDGSLPAHLQDADRSEELYGRALPLQVYTLIRTRTLTPPPRTPLPNTAPDLAPRPTPPPQLPTRHNVFDEDELDRLEVDASRLHIGKRHPGRTADDVLGDRSGGGADKAAILSALATFDSDDDERDDTYDAADVGGTVDAAAGDPDQTAADDAMDEVLFRALRADPALFGRDAATRRGAARARLRAETGLTDEAVEGWAVVLGRDARLRRRLEARYGEFGGVQNELRGTAWRAGGEEEGEGEQGEGEASSRGGRGRGRGRGRGGGGRGGRGGNVAGPTGEKETEVARRRKEANKGSRANHNRRDQRAKKMARGGFPG
ncbi:hypothetical protein QBC33DRAFT_586622 [Phialemonium atrogriseum]|uniref:CUE domain-containing protein n=1 Tax=Phialemonium atrogriseum TaxID=1093897 RepID=A0AAJ0C009_9PEZI|nr:uncharacterized protein QBC33DRAFT_586622 [Phialemonium atrogriseum]KAK1767386.1 hypothetical protein QBC33DRAFT_586622 [Phialemonium atrogriseum]